MADQFSGAGSQYPAGSFYADLAYRIAAIEAVLGTAPGAVPDGSITAYKLAANSVIGAKIAASAVDETKLVAALATKINGKADATNGVLTTPSLILKQSTNPTPTADGDMQWDSSKDRFVVGNGAGGQVSFAPNDWEKIGFYTPSGVSSLVIQNLSAFRMLRLNGWVALSIAGALLFRVSGDNGSTWVQGASDYANGYGGQANNAAAFGVSSSAYGWIVGSCVAGACHVFSGLFARWNGGAVDKSYVGTDTGLNTASQNTTYVISTRFLSASNALQLFPQGGGTLTGEFTLEGLK